MSLLLKVDFHCHSIYSPDSLNNIRGLARSAGKAGLDRLVITDHNSIKGAIEAKKINPDPFIVGEEIKTTKGEILAVFVKEKVPAGLTPEETIYLLREQGAFISVSHPFDPYRGWKRRDLEEISPLIDAVEVFNSRCFAKEMNDLAGDFAREHGLGGTIGSDAHLLSEVGSSYVELPYFDDAATLKEALFSGIPHTNLSSPMVRLGSRFALAVKSLSGRSSEN
jgi:predicted metal-dependent phosphoesterase TrpH